MDARINKLEKNVHKEKRGNNKNKKYNNRQPLYENGIGKEEMKDVTKENRRYTKLN